MNRTRAERMRASTCTTLCHTGQQPLSQVNNHCREPAWALAGLRGRLRASVTAERHRPDTSRPRLSAALAWHGPEDHGQRLGATDAPRLHMALNLPPQVRPGYQLLTLLASPCACLQTGQLCGSRWSSLCQLTHSLAVNAEMLQLSAYTCNACSQGIFHSNASAVTVLWHCRP